MKNASSDRHFALAKNYLHSHRVHDYENLVKRWKAVARACGLKLNVLTHADNYPIYYLEYFPKTPAANMADKGIYLSAGIHGDEPAGPAALIAWAEEYLPSLLRPTASKTKPFDRPLFLLPCLNPWGLVYNSRNNAHGIDLNRTFHQNRATPTKQLKQLLKGRKYQICIMLHEDFDAQGIYLYEVFDNAESTLGAIGAQFIKVACSLGAMGPDNRKVIEGLPQKGGVICRPKDLPQIAYQAEALYLYINHCKSSITTETPSEFGLIERIEAQVRILEYCFDRANEHTL